MEIENEKIGPRVARLLTWVEGLVLAEVNPHSPLLLERLGELCGKLSLRFLTLITLLRIAS